jgi:hypothetical protein
MQQPTYNNNNNKKEKKILLFFHLLNHPQSYCHLYESRTLVDCPSRLAI